MVVVFLIHRSNCVFFFHFVQKYQVSFSMLEIYNEQVRDLLVKNNPKGGLQVKKKLLIFKQLILHTHLHKH